MKTLDAVSTLNPRQMEAVLQTEGPLLIIAGAGSGKTRVITARIAHMLGKGVPQSEILALTFTNKAAAEMETRVKELTRLPLKNLTVKTFHSFGVQMLRVEIEALGYRKNFSIYDESDRTQAIKEAMREKGVRPEGTDLYAVGALFSKIKTGEERWIAGRENTVWKPVFEEYQYNLKVYNALDFDDLLALPIELFERFPPVLDKYHSRYRYVMVDEFQDTSLIQYRLMKMIVKGAVSGGENVEGNICVVGDDDQSIYSWRGANYKNIINFERDFPSLREIKLEQNYRSTSTILEAANGVISNNKNRKDKQLWSGIGGGKPIELFFPENEGEEADFIARQIASLCIHENYRYGDFGILLRTNSLMQRIEEALLAQNIPYTVSGGTSFFSFKEIKDVLSYLRLIGNTDDDVQLLRIINTPRRGIGRGTIEKISALAKRENRPLWQAMEKMRRLEDALFEITDQEDINDFMLLIEKQREEILGRKGLSQKVRALVETIDYWSYLVTEYSKNEKLARWKFLNIQKLIESIENWEKNPDVTDPTLYPYLNRISLLSQGDDSGEVKGKVNLMTIHAAKGLEFPVVFIAGAEDGLIPHSRSMEDAEENNESAMEGGDGGEIADGENAAFSPIEEERRLFYVAITRARDKLYITSCKKRRRSQQDVECVPSPFIAEIPAHLIQEHQKVEEEVISPQEFFARLERRSG
ncbi:MAG: exodeoxyribonuclease V subunit gamma [Spirochaetaceae bacterium]|jgi:DNA helicase-2/ATP-dependent DNA helicase PcrA|nr:exodeoxyribonuclease V subunit gamma [Spirochaetaceae bacterium]